MTTNTPTIAAYIAANTPIGTRYQIVNVPGTELSEDAPPRCPWCHGKAHARMCAELRAAMTKGAN